MNMKKLWWRIRLFVLMTWFDYVPKRRHNFIETFKWTGDKDSWLESYEWGHTPMEALKEDWSYA